MLHIRSRTPHMKGDNRRQRETRPLQSPRSRPHQPTPAPYTKGDTRRQWETTGDKTTSEPKKPTTPTNTQPPHEGRKAETTGDNGRQDHFRASHQPPPTPHMKGDNRRQWETTGDKTTSEPKKPTTPTNTHPTQPETTGDNGRQDHFRAQDGGHTNHPPPPTWRETTGDNGRQRETTGDQTTSEPKKPTTPTNTHPPHEGRQPETMGDNGRQDHFRAQEANHTDQHPPLTWRETTGDNGRQRETRPLQSPRSRPHQPTPRRPDLKLHWEPQQLTVWGIKLFLGTHVSVSWERVIQLQGNHLRWHYSPYSSIHSRNLCNSRHGNLSSHDMTQHCNITPKISRAETYRKIPTWPSYP